MTFCALSTGGGSGTDCALSIDGGSGAYCAISTTQGVGRGSDSGTTFCAQPATAQASAIESLCCTAPYPFTSALSGSANGLTRAATHVTTPDPLRRDPALPTPYRSRRL